MWFQRRMMTVPWTANTSYQVILQNAKGTRIFIKDIRRRQANNFVYIIRKEQIKHTGKLPGEEVTEMIKKLSMELHDRYICSQGT
jgi:hypothetical protein